MYNTSIRDNHNYGNVGDYLKALLNKDCNVDIVSAYFTIYAYHHLKKQLNEIEHLRFLFGEPTFIKQIDPDGKNFRSYKIEDDQLIIPIDLGRITGRSDANGIDLENFNWSVYDLVVIDESHNFKGNPILMKFGR